MKRTSEKIIWRVVYCDNESPVDSTIVGFNHTSKDPILQGSFQIGTKAHFRISSIIDIRESFHNKSPLHMKVRSILINGMTHMFSEPDILRFQIQ